MLDTSWYFEMGVNWVRWHYFRVLFVSSLVQHSELMSELEIYILCLLQ